MTDDDPRKKLDDALAEASASEVLIQGMIDELKHAEGAEAEAKLAELERRLEEIAERIGVPDAESREVDAIPGEMDDKLNHIEQKVKAYRQAQEVKGHHSDQALKQSAESYRGLGVGLTVAYTIIGFPLLGMGIGWLVDRNDPARMSIGIGALIGSVVGVGAAIWMLNRHQSRR
jgi:F0F1-type ATP synthase assembly protein I